MNDDDYMNLNGNWTYRSYHNNPDPSQDDRAFTAELILKQDKGGNLRGKLDSGNPGEVYIIEGKIHKDGTQNYESQDKCFNIDMVAIGSTKQTEGHVYKYYGRLIPKWPEGKDQRIAFVGTNIRTKSPGNPTGEGVVGCFVVTKKESMK